MTEVFPLVLLTLMARFATSKIVLRVFDWPGGSVWLGNWIWAKSVSLVGAIPGAPLAVLYAIDGTLGADPTRSIYSILYADPLSLLGAVPVGLVGAVFGVAEGLVLGVPLAKLLGTLSDEV